MRRPILQPLLFAVIAGLLQQPALGQRDLADTIEKSERSVVRIEVTTKGGGALGSGFIVDESGLLVTNVHVLAGAQQAIAVFPDGRKFKVTGTFLIDEARDICLAKLTGAGFSTLKLHVGAPPKG
jgi:S1-C subfamily serine protease